MNTRSIYFGIRTRVEQGYDQPEWNWRSKFSFAKYILEDNDIPDDCWYCWFCCTGWCDLLGEEHKFSYTPKCTIYDFNKYLLEML